MFEPGAFSRLFTEVDRLKASRVLVLASAGRSEQGHIAAAILGSRAIGVLAEAKMRTPVDVTERAVTTSAERRADALLAVGGGSTIRLGNAMVLRSGLPLVTVRTTYFGSETTDVVGETPIGVKTTKTDPRIRPKALIYDVELTLSVSPKTTAASAFNAMAHAVESLYARERNPLTALMAEEGARFRQRPSAHHQERSRYRGSQRNLVRRVAVGLSPRLVRHGPASQALSRSRRPAWLAPSGNTRHRPSACARLQCVRRATRGRPVVARMGATDPAAEL